MGIKKIQLRRDVPEKWSLNNPILSEVEPKVTPLTAGRIMAFSVTYRLVVLD